MLIVKMVASLIIIFSTSMIGFNLAARFSTRKTSLQDFQTALTILESEINYAANTLDTAMTIIANCVGNQVGEFSIQVANKMKDSNCTSKTFESTLHMFSTYLCLEQRDIHILCNFAATLGKSNNKWRLSMGIDLVFQIAAIGIIVAVLNQVLIRSGREEQAMLTTLAGLIVVLFMIIQQISLLFDTVKTVFRL